jgi:hypothetical protein
MAPQGENMRGIQPHEVMLLAPGIRVCYVHYIHGREEPTRDYGTISRLTEHYVFVKFDRQVEKLGWENTTAQACILEQLELAESQ